MTIIAATPLAAPTPTIFCIPCHARSPFDASARLSIGVWRFQPVRRLVEAGVDASARASHGVANSGRHNLRRILFAAASALIATAAFAQAADPYLWLENVEGAKPLAQVKQWNAETEAVLTKMPGYEEHRQRALAMLNDPRRSRRPTR